MSTHNNYAKYYLYSTKGTSFPDEKRRLKFFPDFKVTLRLWNRKCFTFDIPYKEQHFMTEYGIYLRNKIFPLEVRPLKKISFTWSIFMIVGIAHERCVAVKYPIQHRQNMMNDAFRRLYLLKYILPILFCGILFNIPKFFEAKICWTEQQDMNNIDAIEQG